MAQFFIVVMSAQAENYYPFSTNPLNDGSY